MEENQPNLPVDAVRDYAREQREQEHRTEVSKLQDFDEEALVGIADGLRGDGPALGGVLRPIAGVGDAGADPEDQKRPVPENLQRFSDGRARQTVWQA